MASLSDISIKIVVNTSQADAALAATENKLKAFGNAAKEAENPVAKLGETIKRGLELAGVTLAMGELIAKLKESTKLAAEDAVGKAELERQLKATTGATKEQTAAINEQLEAMERATATSVDQLRPAYETLLRATGSASNAMAGLKLATDIAAGAHKNLGTVAAALAKAHDGNTAALQKLVPGIKGVKDQMGFLTKEFSGAAEKAANLNPYQRLQVIFEQIQKSIGADLLPILSKFADWMAAQTPKIQKFFKDLGDPTTDVGKKFKDLSDKAKAAFDWVTQNADAIGKWATAVFAAVAAYKALQLAMKIAEAAQWALNLAMDANPVGALTLGIAALVGWLVAATGAYNDAATAAGKLAKAKADDKYAQSLFEKSNLGADISGLGLNKTGTARGDAAAASRYSNLEAMGAALGLGSTLDSTGQYKVPIPTGSGAKTTAVKNTPAATILAYIKSTNDKIANANRTFSEEQAKAQRTFDEAKAKAQREFDTATEAADKQHAKNVLDIQTNFNTQFKSIIQQSMDLLRNAFTQGTAFDVGSTFSTMLSKAGVAMTQVTQVIKNGVTSVVSFWGTAASAGVDSLLSTMQTKLAAMKDLQANAAKLQGAGFSQAFIAQVVQAGPDVGNQLAASILGSSADTQKAMSDTFNSIQDISQNGLNDLAKTIYDTQGLQSDSLKAMYAQTQSELAKALADENSAYATSQADIQSKFDTAVADANQTMVDAISDAAQALYDSLDGIEKAFNAKLLTFKGSLAAFASQIADIRNQLNTGMSNASDLISNSSGPGESAGSQFGSSTPWALAAANGSVANGIALNNGPSVTVIANTNATPQTIGDAVAFAIRNGSPYTYNQIMSELHG